jgi:hypothetical protein
MLVAACTLTAIIIAIKEKMLEGLPFANNL